MQNNTVKELIQKLGEDYWFEIWTDNSEEPIVDGRDCYNAFDDYYNTEVKKVVIDHPNDEELQVIKLYISKPKTYSDLGKFVTSFQNQTN